MSQKPIRVMMLFESFHLKSYGGAERQLISLIPLLQERGIEISVLARRHPGRSAHEVAFGVPVYRTPYFPIRAGFALLYTLNGLWHIYRKRPDILHAYGLFAPATTATLASQLFNIPMIVKIMRSGTHGDVISVKRKSFGQARLRLFAKYINKFAVISEDIREELLEENVPGEKQLFIPNGVDVERFKTLPPAEKQRVRTEMGFGDEPLVIYVGRLLPVKRVHHLLTSWKTIHERFPKAQLLIVGTGDQEKKLKAMAGENVQFVGRVDNVEKYLQISDLYVLPSSSEGLSNSLLEAMAVELPIIATEVGGSCDLITKDNGWCIPPDDVEALTTSLQDALQGLDACAAMGKRSREHILADFQLSVTADKYVSLYKELLAEVAEKGEN